MKGSNASLGSITNDPRTAGISNPQPSPLSPADRGFALAGPSALPDPATNAYRPDLADIALAGQVIASHYAEPLLRHLAEDTPFLSGREDGAATIAMLADGDELLMLDCSLGWAWGYAGADRHVGYVRASAIRS